eukprot:3874174-Prymnesium_polylepis.1
MSCGELAAGLEWLDVGLPMWPMEEAELHGLVRGLDRDADGLITIEEWAQALPGLPDTQAATQEALTALTLQPKPVRELQDGAAAARTPPPPVPANRLYRFKFKLKTPKGYTCVWSNKGSGARTELSIWAPEAADTNALQKRSRARVCA